MTQRKYNTTIAPLWATKFNGFSMSRLRITKEMLGVLAQILKDGEGGQFVVKQNSAKVKKSISPHAYLEYQSPEEVQRYLDESAARSSEV